MTGIYQHWKGDFYYVIGEATNLENLEKHIVYRDKHNNFFSRSKEKFLGSVKNETYNGPRFKLIREVNAAHLSIASLLDLT